MEAIGYLIGVLVVAVVVWASIAPFLERRYPRDNDKKPTKRD